MYECFHCLTRGLIWDADFTFEDYGLAYHRRRYYRVERKIWRRIMDAVKYLKTLKRMKEDNSIEMEEWLDFIVSDPENKVEKVEKWGTSHRELKDLEKEIDRLYSAITATLKSHYALYRELEDRVDTLEQEVWTDD